MTEPLNYIIFGAPVTKKNSQVIAVNRKTGRPFIRQNQRYDEYEAIASWYLLPRPAKPIDSPVTVRCVYYMPSRRRVDLTNLMAATHDILVTCGVLADDNRNIIASVDGSRVMYDNKNPRVEITIAPYDTLYEVWGEKK